MNAAQSPPLALQCNDRIVTQSDDHRPHREVGEATLRRPAVGFLISSN